LDEGHTIRNPATQLFKAMHRLRTEYRLLLTGTPVQNKLKELWALMDWATKGRLFGSQSEFTEKYVEHINKGQDPRAPEECVKIAKIVADNLVKTIQPVLLQRKKCEKQDILQLPDKVELVVWIPLATQQRELYQEYLSTRAFKEIVRNADFPIEAVTYLKSLCR
jgi:SNF2 family DNA or RNA helicase